MFVVTVQKNKLVVWQYFYIQGFNSFEDAHTTYRMYLSLPVERCSRCVVFDNRSRNFVQSSCLTWLTSSTDAQNIVKRLGNWDKVWQTFLITHTYIILQRDFSEYFTNWLPSVPFLYGKYYKRSSLKYGSDLCSLRIQIHWIQIQKSRLLAKPDPETDPDC